MQWHANCGQSKQQILNKQRAKHSAGSRAIRAAGWSALWLGALILATIPAPAQTERKRINFEAIEALAAAAAGKDYAPVTDDSRLPEQLRGLTYDQYRNIRFRPEKEFWREQGLGFRMALFHPGYLFKQPVTIHEFTADYVQPIRFSRDFFNYEGSGLDEYLPADLGYAGFRLSHPLNTPDIFDEIAVFQGASYYRMLGQGQAYGLSARGLAINAGIYGTPEEFPVFTRFWAGQPQPGAASVTLFALLDSPSVAGAYQFVITPGRDTVTKVRATLYFRREAEHVGFAPLTSMYWFGENTTRPFDDYRPEVHDSDGLAMKSGTGEVLWRPLANDPATSRTYEFSFDEIKGFGILQRDRHPRSYEDYEARYHLRPGVWVRPEGNWGPGRIRLVELSTGHELSDNIVAAWEPDDPPPAGEPYRIAYSQSWGLDPNPAAAGSWVVATRSGTHEWAPGTRYVVLEFSGPALDELGENDLPEAFVDLNSEAAVLGGPPRVECYPGGDTWRVSFEVRKAEPAANIEGIEARCALKLGEDYLSETWTSWLKL